MALLLRMAGGRANAVRCRVEGLGLRGTGWLRSGDVAFLTDLENADGERSAP